MVDITEYGDVMLNVYVDEWGRRRINGLLEDGTKIIVTVGIILKQWSQIGVIVHTFNRHKTFKLTQNLKTLGEWTLPVPAFLKQWFATLQTTHVFRRPYRSMKLMQALNLAHVFRRPFRFFKLTQNVNLTHVLRANKLVKYLTQILKPLHNWVKRALGGFPFKISVEERQPVNVVVEAAEPIKIIVEERT